MSQPVITYEPEHNRAKIVLTASGTFRIRASTRKCEICDRPYESHLGKIIEHDPTWREPVFTVFTLSLPARIWKVQICGDEICAYRAHYNGIPGFNYEAR